MKKRVNVTVDGKLYAAAQRVAKARKRYLSSMLEWHLHVMVEHMALHDENCDNVPEEHWLDRFHRQHLAPDTD